tara:strand:+ start:1565 stop:1750 length:186 start_codon:yes stop_codon:yes gene_type:complete
MAPAITAARCNSHTCAATKFDEAMCAVADLDARAPGGAMADPVADIPVPLPVERQPSTLEP